MKKLLAIAAMLPALAHAEFFTGNELYNKMLDEGYGTTFGLGYVAGVYDVGAKVIHCAPNGITLGQVRDMVKQYLYVNPDRRHHSADSLVNDVLKTAWPCKNNGRAI